MKGTKQKAGQLLTMVLAYIYEIMVKELVKHRKCDHKP
jgi:hypothetical protein